VSHVFPRHTKVQPPVIAGGEGCYLIDDTGKQYFDGSGGAAVSCLGHGDAEVTDAIKAQLDKIAFAHTGFFTSEPAEELADLLIAHAPQNIERVMFVSSGSEAVEAALKLARQYFLEEGEPKRCKIIARRQSYHGNTLGALAAGGNEWRRKPFEPLMAEISHIAPCYEYRDRLESETAQEYGHRAADELEAEIERLGPQTVMAFIAEPVVGATLGAVPAVEGYFKRIREICDCHGVLLILDEVMCGMGRTGKALRPISSPSQRGLGPAISRLVRCCVLQKFIRPSNRAPGFFSMAILISPIRLPAPPALRYSRQFSSAASCPAFNIWVKNCSGRLKPNSASIRTSAIFGGAACSGGLKL